MTDGRITPWYDPRHRASASAGGGGVTIKRSFSAKRVLLSADVVGQSDREQVLPANTARYYLLIQNRTSFPLYLSVGVQPTVEEGIAIAGYGSFEMRTDAPTEPIWLLTENVGHSALVVEGFVSVR